MIEVFGVVMDNLFVQLSPCTFLQFHRWSHKPGFGIAKVHTQICLPWLILSCLLLKWPLMNKPSSPSLILTVWLAKNRILVQYTLSSNSICFLYLSQILLHPTLRSKTHCSSLFETNESNLIVFILLSFLLGNSPGLITFIFFFSKAYQRHRFSRPGSWLSPLEKTLISS